MQCCQLIKQELRARSLYRCSFVPPSMSLSGILIQGSAGCFGLTGNFFERRAAIPTNKSVVTSHLFATLQSRFVASPCPAPPPSLLCRRRIRGRRAPPPPPPPSSSSLAQEDGESIWGTTLFTLGTAPLVGHRSHLSLSLWNLAAPRNRVLHVVSEGGDAPAPHHPRASSAPAEATATSPRGRER